MRRVAVAVLLVLSVAAPSGAQVPLPLVRLTPVATMSQPLAMATRSGDAALYIAEKTGAVRAVRNGLLDPQPVLDLSADISQGGEQGLLGLTFSPNGTDLYVDITDRAGDTRVLGYTMAAGRADTTTRREILFVDQPFANHNGGTIAFGPDGFLYVSLGDGGGGGDPLGAGQRLDTLLGKILRIDPLPGGGYSVPATNPFVGEPGALPEIWAYGLRNPWKFHFDRLAGDLWIGDVGQNAWEEIDYQSVLSAGGENYGWNRMEGTHVYSGTEPPDHVPPVYEYPHIANACSVTGGPVYRGTRIPALQGAYIFGDFCTGRIQSLRLVAGVPIVQDVLPTSVPALAGFGEDTSGEIYALSLSGTVWSLDPFLP
jgi:glucose/arabinose dehydrogenase